ncbi:VCBS domain-containing protein [Aeromonas veronii]|uniref:VCBS domain-containing protein n=1 Tax=Aeromonas veronii TaxID=654 RepID=UPI0012F65436|nr:VCBS domain-containing protein [Aeromonas veronii]
MTEDVDTNPAVEGVQLTVGGHLTISDADRNDKPEFDTTKVGAPQGALGSLTITADGTWSYNVDNNAVQYLDAGESKVEVFTVYGKDGSSHEVTITINGAEDKSTITVTGTDKDAGGDRRRGHQPGRGGRPADRGWSSDHQRRGPERQARI